MTPAPRASEYRKRLSVLLLCVIALFPCMECSRDASERPEYQYDGERVEQELHRLEQMTTLSEVLGYDAKKLEHMLKAGPSATSLRQKQRHLVRCRDEYLRGLKGRSGVPLGGIGAGTVELWPDGALHDWRITDNWDVFTEPEFSFFAIRTDPEGLGRPRVRILQDSAWAGRQRTEAISYAGWFPFAFLDYGQGGQPVAVRAEVFSPLIPHNAEDSCLPLICFKFTLENVSDKTVKTSLMFAAGVSPLLEKGKGSSERNAELSTVACESGGNSIALSTDLGRSSYTTDWPGSFVPPEFSSSGRLSGDGGAGNSRMAIAGEFDLKPHETKQALFLLSWFFPDFRQRPTRSYQMEVKFKELGTTQEAEAGKYFGRFYNRFGSAREVVRYFMANRERLEAETRLWHELICASTLEEWLKHFLPNSLYPLFKSSFWTENGLFNILESTNAAPNPDCIHVRYYGSIPLALMFPELDKQVLRRLAKYRGPFGGEPVGQIPEQFYGFSLEIPFGRPFIQNNLVFVLMVYRDYLWTGDEKFLKELWPAVTEAMALAASAETDGDHLPDNTGIKQSYDDYDMGDSSSYISGIWLASLRAAEEMALIMGQSETAKNYHDLFENGQRAMEELLWRGDYYAFTEGERGKVCFADALNGQWYADMLGLGDLLDRDRIRSSIAAIFTYNDPATAYGIVNGFLPGIGIDFPPQAGYFQAQSGSVWTGTTFAAASLGLYRGLYDEPMNAVREVYENYAEHLGNLWNLREANDPESGVPMAWPFYYRPMSLWSVLLGLEGFHYDAGKAQLTIGPPEKVSSLKAPLIVPGAVGEMEISQKSETVHFSLTVHSGSLSLKEIHLPRGSEWSGVSYSALLNAAAVGATAASDGSEVVVTFSSILHIDANETLRIELENGKAR